jgi:hypothetical protein
MSADTMEEASGAAERRSRVAIPVSLFATSAAPSAACALLLSRLLLCLLRRRLGRLSR